MFERYSRGIRFHVEISLMFNISFIFMHLSVTYQTVSSYNVILHFHHKIKFSLQNGMNFPCYPKFSIWNIESLSTLNITEPKASDLYMFV